MVEQNLQSNDANSRVSFPETFNVRLKMKSDWRIGSGAGRPGNVDSLIARDADGFPFIPAKTLTGIWRDAAEMLAYALDEGGKGGRWAEWIDVVFGNQPNQMTPQEIDLYIKSAPEKLAPRPATLSISPASLPEGLRQLISRHANSKDGRLLSALTFIKPGVGIDERSGTARTDFLRFEEMARTGAELVARCELNMEGWNPTQKTAAATLLLASARLVERLGGKRRRGAGRCELLIEGSDAQGAIDWLEKDENKQPPDLPPVKKSVDSESETSADDDHPNAVDKATGGGELSAEVAIQDSGVNEWMSLSIRLKLKTPVTIASRTLGNVSETLDFVPGTYLLPHVTRSLKKLGYDCRAAVARGDIQVLPATIEINNERGLPAPNALARKKADGDFGAVINRLRETMSEQTKSLRDGYVMGRGNGKLPIYRRAPKTLLTHNTVEDDAQRPTEEVGGVYSREAIAAYGPGAKPGVALRAELRLRKPIADALLQKKGDWWTGLEGLCRLGMSRKDDYGAVELEVLCQAPQQIKHHPSRDPQKSNDGKELLTMWLLSDVLLRDEGLRQTSLIEVLQREMEENLREFGNSDISLKEVEWKDSDSTSAGQNADDKRGWMTSLLDTRRIESWHEGWGLPRPSLVAIKAGSCIVFEVESRAVDLNALAKLEREGIGERRGEGYGQLCFNHPLLINEIRSWEPSSDGAANSPDDGSSADEGRQASAQLSEGERRYAEIVEEAAWREALCRAVLKATDDEDKRKDILGLAFDERKNSAPPMSQLGGLRSVVGRLNNDNANLVTDWLDHLKGTPNRREKWNGALEKVCKLFGDGNQKTTNGKENWSIKKDRAWEAMGGNWQDPPTLVRRPEELREMFWAEAVRALVDAGIRAHKRELERMQSDK